MKLFISYSHDDKTYVKTLATALESEDVKHQVWMDRNLFGGQEWWEAILNEIEKCDCFICILTPYSVNSIYCNIELKYAVDLNKPILPLMLKLCELPTIIENKQREDISELSQDRIVLKCVSALGVLYAEVIRNKFALPNPLPNRPQLPRTKNAELKIVRPSDVIDIEFQMANMNIHTHRNYSRWILQFLRETNDEFIEIRDLNRVALKELIEALSPNNLVEWLDTIASHKSNQSVSQARAAILWLAHLLFERGVIDEVKIALIKNAPLRSAPKQRKHERLWLSVAQMKQMLQAAQDYTTSHRNIAQRNYAVISLSVTLGFARAELTKLAWDDLAFDSITNKANIRVGANGTKRIIALPHSTYQALLDWARCHPNPTGKNPIFTRVMKNDLVTTNGISDKAIWLIIKEISYRAGLEDITPEVIRRSFARNAYDLDVSIELIKDALGHASLTTTENMIASGRSSKVSLDVWADTLSE